MALGDNPEEISAGALEVYQRRSGLVENQIRNHMAALEKARDNMRAQRTGPSSAERLLSIAAALGQPTRTGSFGETLGNVGAVLSSQEKAKREAAALAEKYDLEIGNDQLRLLMQGETSAMQGLRASIAREAAAARAGLGQFYSSPKGGLTPKPGTGGQPPYPKPDNSGVYVIEDPRQLEFLPPNTPVRRPNDLTVKYTREAPGG